MVLVSVACNADPDTVAVDAAVVVDSAPACTPSGVSDADATRSTEAASVRVSTLLRNALEHCAKPDLTFDLVLDTHSVDLLAIDLAASARIETSSGGAIDNGLTWAPGSESSHHRDGVLTAPEPALDGAEWLRLTIAEVAGVDRVFEWDASLLAHDLP